MDVRIGRSLRECIVLIAFLCGCSSPHSQDQGAGIWSAKGVSLSRSAGDRAIEVLAPDGNARIAYEKEGLVLYQNGRKYLLSEVVSTAWLTEVIWSPDSRRFIVNTSDGGAIGTWDSLLYSIKDNGPPSLTTIRDVLGTVASAFPDCETPEIANIGTVDWLDDPGELLVVIESPPHSSCRNMGDMKGIRVSISSGTVLDQIPDPILRRDWMLSLGPRFIAD